MKKKYGAPKSEYIRFDVTDVITDVLPLDQYATQESSDAGAPSVDVGTGGGIGGPNWGGKG